MFTAHSFPAHLHLIRILSLSSVQNCPRAGCWLGPDRRSPLHPPLWPCADWSLGCDDVGSGAGAHRVLWLLYPRCCPLCCLPVVTSHPGVSGKGRVPSHPRQISLHLHFRLWHTGLGLRWGRWLSGPSRAILWNRCGQCPRVLWVAEGRTSLVALFGLHLQNLMYVATFFCCLLLLFGFILISLLMGTPTAKYVGPSIREKANKSVQDDTLDPTRNSPTGRGHDTVHQTGNQENSPETVGVCCSRHICGVSAFPQCFCGSFQNVGLDRVGA